MSSEYIANRLNSSTYESIGIIPNSVTGVPLFTELSIDNFDYSIIVSKLSLENFESKSQI